MTAITNLYSKYVYKTGATDLPILALVHGWGETATIFSAGTLRRMALYGFFVVSVGMRGRNSADGARDASGREVYDIYDAIVDVRAKFPAIVSATKAAVVGYSGGGGNALACACKFPDFFNVVVSHFGISDYGRDATNSWYINNGGGYTAQIATAVGGTPAVVPDNYYARDTTVAIHNYTSGYLYLYHDDQDAVVPSIHSDRISTAMDAAGLTNYAKSITTTTDNPRWLHGVPSIAPGIISAEATWAAKILSEDAWTVPTTGTLTVIGYVKTKRFTIWLNTGLDAAATVVYDTVAGTYTVTPLTSNAVVAVTITQGALTASGNTNGETLFTVA